jgi:hypothetical protein
MKQKTMPATASPSLSVLRPQQMPDLCAISERQVRFLMMRWDLQEGCHWFKKTSRMALLSVQVFEGRIKKG